MARIHIAGKAIVLPKQIKVEQAIPLGGVYIDGCLQNQTTSQTIYTITSGKVLYVTNLVFAAYNTSTLNIGNLGIFDDVDCRVPIVLPTAVVGNVAPQLGGIQITFPTPKKFYTNLNVTITSGTITYSISFTGYEL